MSTGYECKLFETTPGRWFYALQRWDCPVGAWDWTEYADVVGPFPTKDAAHEHLSSYEANPGGYSTDALTENRTPETQRRLEAVAAQSQSPRRSRW